MGTEKRRARPHGTGGLYQRADGMWIGTIEAGWTVRGTRRRLTVSAKTRKRCQEKLRDLQRRVATSGVPSEGASGAVTLKAWAEEWLADQRVRVRPQTWQSHRNAVQGWIVPTLGRKRLNQLTAADARSLIDFMKAKELSPSTANRIYTAFRMILKDAVRAGYQVPQSVLEARGPGLGQLTRAALTADQCIRVLGACQTPTERALIGFALLLGMRPSEVRGLLWDNVHLEDGYLDVLWQLKRLPYNDRFDRASGFTVPAGYQARRLSGATHLVRPKTEAGVRRLPLPAFIADALRELRNSNGTEACHGLVFHTPTGAFLLDYAHANIWKDVCERAGVFHTDPSGEQRPFVLYEARHSTASLLRHLRVQEEVIIQILGHATIQSTRTYIHADPAAAGEAVAELEEKLNVS